MSERVNNGGPCCLTKRQASCQHRAGGGRGHPRHIRTIFPLIGLLQGATCQGYIRGGIRLSKKSGRMIRSVALRRGGGDQEGGG